LDAVADAKARGSDLGCHSDLRMVARTGTTEDLHVNAAASSVAVGGLRVCTGGRDPGDARRRCRDPRGRERSVFADRVQFAAVWPEQYHADDRQGREDGQRREQGQADRAPDREVVVA